MPVGTIDWTKAIGLWYKKKVEIIDSYDRVVHSPSISVKVPSVVRYMGKPRGSGRIIKFSKNMVYKRDRAKCQYCSIKVSKAKATLDHVIPKSRGGNSSWTNIVIACSRCNQIKRDRTPFEAGMTLTAIPIKPTTMPNPVMILGMKRLGIPESWIPYIREED
jgi:5-methylcytosine-specific restriction endonuclease McrA